MKHQYNMPFKLAPGALIAFEGLDATGKSTQIDRIEHDCFAMGTTGDTALFDPVPKFLHMPSGDNAVGNAVYELTESKVKLASDARQLLHLAAHAQEVELNIKPHLEGGGVVFLDRSWWSTIAYGGFWQGSDANTRWRSFIRHSVWQSYAPTLTFLFMHPWKKDRHNTTEVETGYRWLQERYDSTTVEIIPGNEADVSLQIFEELLKRGLYRNGDE